MIRGVRGWRWVAVALAIPVGLTMWLMVGTIWLALFSAGNLLVAERNHSIPALARAVDGGARAAGLASWAARGWGIPARLIPSLSGLEQLGADLGRVSAAGLRVAPALPDALGAHGPRRYLFVALNDAELFASGGAPLNAVLVEVNNGEFSIPVSGSVSAGLNPGNVPYAWPVLGSAPWYREGREYPFANSNFHPDFEVSGASMLAAWNALDFPDADAVLTVDMAAAAAVLASVGPVDAEGYGIVDSENLTRKVLVDAYREYPEDTYRGSEERRKLNDQFQAAFIDRLRDRDLALLASRAIWELIPSRHVQAYAADPALQSAIASLGASGALAPPEGDLLGVFLQGGPSKVSIFQARHISRRVVVAEDGSARVTQTTRFSNDVPDDLEGDPASYRGYLALTLRQRVAFRIPPTATMAAVSVRGGEPIVPEADVGPFPDGRGGLVLWQGQDLAPGESSSTDIAYDLPPGSFGSGSGLAYSLTANPQATTRPVTLEVEVQMPAGTDPSPRGEGWEVDGSTALWRGTLDRTVDLHVDGS